jgi:flagellar basal-body rod protein FlgF
MSPDGALQTIVGQPVLDASGAPIQLDPAGGPPAIARDGAITQGGRTLGAIGLFQLDPGARLERTENGVVSDVPAIAQLDFNAVGIVAGHVERANVNPVQELTRLVAVQRAFEAVSNGLHDVEAALQDALRTLGGA